jgi:hypothetical protein
LEATHEEKLAASVFALGLRHGFVRREDVVRWADRRIEGSDTPAAWLIELSMSQDRHWLDVVSVLNRVAEGVDRAATCRAVYALLPDAGGLSFNEAAAYAACVYRITAECLDWDWAHELLRATDRIADDFDLFAYLRATETEVVGALLQFVDDDRDEQIVRLLDPVRWSETG